MRLPKSLVPALLVAVTAVVGGWFFLKGNGVEEVEPMRSQLATTPGSTTLTAERPVPIRNQEQGMVLKAQGTWQDPLPVGVPATAGRKGGDG